MTTPRHDKTVLDSFMRELWATTTPHPFTRDRIWQMKASFEVKPFDGRIHLGCVYAFERSKGNGSAALDWLCALADRHGVTITGQIAPVGAERPRLNVNQLRAWYKRHGFVVTGHDIVRTPQLSTQASTRILCLTP